MTVNQLLPGKFMWSYFRIASSALLLVAALTTVAAAQITPSQDAYTDTAHPTTNYGPAITLGVASTGSSIQTTDIRLSSSVVNSVGVQAGNIAKANVFRIMSTARRLEAASTSISSMARGRKTRSPPASRLPWAQRSQQAIDLRG